MTVDDIRDGFWSDAQNAATGHELWLAPTGAMLCVTMTQHRPLRLIEWWSEFPDGRWVGQVHSHVMTFPAGSEPIVPPPATT